MTPEELRRIFDPEQRRKGFEAWKSEQAAFSGATTATVAPKRAKLVTEAIAPRELTLTNEWAADFPSYAPREFWSLAPPTDLDLPDWGLPEFAGLKPDGHVLAARREADAAAEREMLEAVGELVALRLLNTLSPETLAALQPKLEVRTTDDGRTEAVVTRKTLRKD